MKSDFFSTVSLYLESASHSKIIHKSLGNQALNSSPVPRFTKLQKYSNFFSTIQKTSEKGQKKWKTLPRFRGNEIQNSMSFGKLIFFKKESSNSGVYLSLVPKDVPFDFLKMNRVYSPDWPKAKQQYSNNVNRQNTNYRYWK